MFANNGRWVKIHTDSSAVKTTGYKDKHGHVLNPVSIKVEYVDEDGNTIQATKTYGDDATSPGAMYGKNEEATFTPPKLRGYTFDYATIDGGQDKHADNPVVFTPKSDGYTIKLVYKKGDHRLQITVDGALDFKAGATIDKNAILGKVTAKTWDGKTISRDNITVFPEKIDSSTPGKYSVVITATDSNGNKNSITEDVFVGMNWGKMEVGGGWLVEDFTFDGSQVT